MRGLTPISCDAVRTSALSIIECLCIRSLNLIGGVSLHGVEASSRACGERNQKYRTIYWYNKSFGLPGTRPGGEEPEWELFDCEADPLELLNIYHDPEHAQTVRLMKEVLDQKTVEIGEVPKH